MNTRRVEIKVQAPATMIKGLDYCTSRFPKRQERKRRHSAQKTPLCQTHSPVNSNTRPKFLTPTTTSASSAIVSSSIIPSSPLAAPVVTLHQRRRAGWHAPVRLIGPVNFSFSEGTRGRHRVVVVAGGAEETHACCRKFKGICNQIKGDCES